MLGYVPAVSGKSERIARQIEHLQGGDWPAQYLAYFECFNQGLFYESHDVLEDLWLQDRHGPNGNFYKGLIQLAGAFVHLQKHTAARPRLRPAVALFRLAHANLGRYSEFHEGLNLREVGSMIDCWIDWVEAGRFEQNPFPARTAPELKFLPRRA